MLPPAADCTLLVKKGGTVHHWLNYADWMWMGAIMIAWILLIGAIGYLAVLTATRQADRPPARHGLPTKT
jgi:hypothetical protein